MTYNTYVRKYLQYISCLSRQTWYSCDIINNLIAITDVIDEETCEQDSSFYWCNLCQCSLDEDRINDHYKKQHAVGKD